MIKKVVLLLSVMFMTSCTGCESQNTVGTVDSVKSNGIGVYMLFETDDVKMYRFYDKYEYHYYAVMKDRATVMSIQSRQQGKTRVTEEEVIETIRPANEKE